MEERKILWPMKLDSTPEKLANLVQVDNHFKYKFLLQVIRIAIMSSFICLLCRRISGKRMCTILVNRLED